MRRDYIVVCVCVCVCAGFTSGGRVDKYPLGIWPLLLIT